MKIAEVLEAQERADEPPMFLLHLRIEGENPRPPTVAYHAISIVEPDEIVLCLCGTFRLFLFNFEPCPLDFFA